MNSADDNRLFLQVMVIDRLLCKLVNDAEGRELCLSAQVDIGLIVQQRLDRIHVELFDNSHISGQFTVASCVSYEDGQPDRKNYRLYRLHTGNSDVDSMSNWELKEKSTGELTVAVEGDEWKKDCEKAFNKLGAKVTIPGFRKGKAPKKIVEKAVTAQECELQAIDDNANTWREDPMPERAA